LLSELFDFTGLIHRLNYCMKVVNEHSASILGNPQEMLEKAVAGLRRDIVEVSGKFRLQLKGLLNVESDPELNVQLQERVKKAAVFFSGKLDDLMKEMLESYAVETDNRITRRSVNEAFGSARKDCAAKLECLNAVRSGFQISKYLDAKAKSAVEIPVVKPHSGKKIDYTSITILHPDLFQALKDWRNNKAQEMEVLHFQILHQKTLLDLSNILPQSVASLKRIKGIGKKKAQIYGGELLEMITSYCIMENIEIPEEQAAEQEAPVRKKPDTKRVTLDQFNSGRTASQIAEERKLSITTIEGHLAHYVGTGEIPVTEFVSQETADLIASHFEGTNDLKMGPVKEALGEKVSWSEIRFVMNHLKRLRSK